MAHGQIASARQERRAWVVEGAVALAAAYALAVSARFRVTVPLSPVPITGQTLTVLLIGALMPRRAGLAAVGAYLVGGALGLPLFAGGSLAGPTGGYLLGFVACVWLVSTLTEPRTGVGRRPGNYSASGTVGVGAARALLVLLAGSAVIYAFGLPWLAVFVGWDRVLPLGLLPFVVGDALKLVCALTVVVARTHLRRGGKTL